MLHESAHDMTLCMHQEPVNQALMPYGNITLVIRHSLLPVRTDSSKLTQKNCIPELVHAWFDAAVVTAGVEGVSDGAPVGVPAGASAGPPLGDKPEAWAVATPSTAWQ